MIACALPHREIMWALPSRPTYPFIHCSVGCFLFMICCMMFCLHCSLLFCAHFFIRDLLRNHEPVKSIINNQFQNLPSMFETVILFRMPLPFTLANKFATTLFQTSKFIKRLFVLSAWFGAQWPCKRSK